MKNLDTGLTGSTINYISRPTYVAIPFGLYTVNSGVAGFIDTDVSATTGIDTGKIWCVSAIVAGFASQTVAVRAHGSAIDTTTWGPFQTLFTYVDAAGHVDLLRNAAANVQYFFQGYFL